MDNSKNLSLATLNRNSSLEFEIKTPSFLKKLQLYAEVEAENHQLFVYCSDFMIQSKE